MTVDRFPQQKLFLAADAALREVIDQLTPEHLATLAPAEWSMSGRSDLTVRDTLVGHARDEAWIPDLVRGRTIDEVGDAYVGDLLGADPVRSYDVLNDAATAALSGELDPQSVVHFSYGDFPLEVGLVHLSIYRGFQAWSIARHLGIPFTMSDDLVELLWLSVEPQLEGLRAMGVFQPEVAVPEGASRETQLLAKTGYWRP